MLYRYARDTRLLLRDPVMSPMGFRFVGNEAMERGSFEPEETELVKQWLRKVDVFVNLGANIGYYCCIALQSGKRVIAFEPIETNLAYLYRNIDANGWRERIEVFPLALGDHAGIIEIFGSGTAASLVEGWATVSRGDWRLVPINTLDAVLGNRLRGQRCLFLIDVEGAESSVLEGASGQLGLTPAPIWVVEIAALEHQPRGVRINPKFLATFDRFLGQGYKAYTFDRDYRPIPREGVVRVVEQAEDGFRTHNFLLGLRGNEWVILRVFRVSEAYK